MNNFLSKKLILLDLKRKSSLSSLANYKPFITFQKFIFISGQLPIEDNKLKFEGKIDSDLTKEQADKSIFLTTTNLLWNLSDAVNELKTKKKIKCLNIRGYFNCSSNFENHSSFLNISSDLIIKVLGEKNGFHSRSVLGVNSLPKNSPCEIDGIFGILD